MNSCEAAPRKLRYVERFVLLGSLDKREMLDG